MDDLRTKIAKKLDRGGWFKGSPTSRLNRHMRKHLLKQADKIIKLVEKDLK